MARTESPIMPSYRGESVLGKLRDRVMDPASHALSPVIKVLEPAVAPFGQAGREVYTAFTHEGAVRRKAAFIEKLQTRFGADGPKGTDLLERSLTLLQDLEKEGTDWAGQEDQFTRMSDILYELQGWLPDTYMGDVWMNPKKEGFKTMTQELLAGYLFHKNAELFQEEGKAHDPEKARRQVKGVAAMLLGHHAHMGTGEGKSTVVLPIVALIESRTSKKKDVILATASDQSVAELQTHVARLEKALPASNRCQLETYSFDLTMEDAEGNAELEAMRRQMQREAVLGGKYSEDLRQKVRDIYWKERMKGTLVPARSDMVENKTGASRILITTERDMVFAFEEDPEKFVRQTPTILMDEADIPYRRQTPYVMTNEAQYYSPRDVEDSMGEWLLHYIVNDRIRYPTATDAGDFIPTQNGFSLTEEATGRLRGLNLKNFVDNWGSHSAAKRAFKRGIKLIGHEIGISDPQDLKHFEGRMRGWLKENLPSTKLPLQEEGVQEVEEERVTDMQSMVITIAERLAVQYYQRGVGYLMEPGSSEVKIRDAYIDDLLEGHRHQPQIQSAILAMNGKYVFVPPYRTSGRSLHFQTVVSTLQDKVRCASGSLLFPDLLDQKIKKDAFASFLEEATGKSVVLISPPDIKKAPVPVLDRTHGEAMDRLVHDVSKRKEPRLVICYDRLEGEALQSKFVAENPGKKVVYVPIHPTAEEVARYCRDLAEGTIDILISAGNLGFGVNIVKGNGEFPDLHVALYGLPENQLQVVQALGRRRRAGDDFSWYVSEPEIYNYIGDFRAETSWRERVIQGFLSVEQMLNGYEEVKSDPRKALVFVADLLHQHEIVRMADDAYVTFFDQSLDKVRTYAFERLEERIRADIGQVNIPISSGTSLDAVMKELEKRSTTISHAKLSGSIDAARRAQWIAKNIALMVSQYGLPDDLDEDMQHELAVASPSLQAQNMKDLVTNKFITHVLGRGLTARKSLVDTYVDEWFEERKKNMEEMSRLLSDNYRLERMFPVAVRSARDEFAQAAGLTPDPSMDAKILESFHPFDRVPPGGAPPGLTIGTFNVGDGHILGCRRGDEPLLLSSFQPDKGGFDWEMGRLSGRMGLMPLGSPIGKAANEKENLYFLWTSRT